MTDPGSSDLFQQFLPFLILTRSGGAQKGTYVKILLAPFWHKIVLLILRKLHPCIMNTFLQSLLPVSFVSTRSLDYQNGRSLLRSVQQVRLDRSYQPIILLFTLPSTNARWCRFLPDYLRLFSSIVVQAFCVKRHVQPTTSTVGRSILPETLSHKKTEFEMEISRRKKQQRETHIFKPLDFSPTNKSSLARDRIVGISYHGSTAA